MDNSHSSSNDSGGLDDMFDAVNTVIMALAELRQDFTTMHEISWRMDDGGDGDYFYSSYQDESQHSTSERRSKSTIAFLHDQLPLIAEWALRHNESLVYDFEHLDSSNVQSLKKAEWCKYLEIDVRRVQNAMLVEQARMKFTNNDGEEGEDKQTPPLTESQRLTLLSLRTFDPSILASARMAYEAMPRAENKSERTIRSSISKLLELKLAERPEGRNQGVRLTLQGRRLASKLAD